MKNLPVQIAPGRTLSRAPQPETLDEIRVIAKAYVKAPQFKNWTHEDDCFMAIMYGMDCGLTCTQSLTYVMVVNGRASLWGEAVMGLCIATGTFCHATHKEWIDHSDPSNPVAHCIVKRLPYGSPQESTFSWEQVKKAKLDQKTNRDGKNVSLYNTYGPDMLAARARSRALKKTWPDVLAGMAILEEQQDAVTSSVSSGDGLHAIANDPSAALGGKLSGGHQLPSAKTPPPTPTLLVPEGTHVVRGSIRGPEDVKRAIWPDDPIPTEDAQAELEKAAAEIVEEALEDRATPLNHRGRREAKLSEPTAKERRGSTTKEAQQELLDRESANAQAD